MKRSQARELAMQLLFSMEARNDFSPECKDAFLEFYPPENQKNYVNSVYGAFADHMEEVDFDELSLAFSNFSEEKKEYARQMFVEMSECDGYVDPREKSLIEKLV